jgi:hypothetical protein
VLKAACYRWHKLIQGDTETKLEEMDLPEDKVLERLNAVSTAKRLANMVIRVYNVTHSDAHTVLALT